MPSPLDRLLNGAARQVTPEMRSAVRDLKREAEALAAENAALRRIVGEAINEDEHARNWLRAAQQVGDPEPRTERYILARRIIETPQVVRLAEKHAPICTCELCGAWRELARVRERENRSS